MSLPTMCSVTDAASRSAPPRAEDPAAQQHDAVTQIHIALHGGGNLDDQGHDGTQGGKEGSQHQLADFDMRHSFSLLSFCLVF